MVLAADVGGTKTLVGLFATDQPRPELVRRAEFRTLDFNSLEDVVAAFLADGPATAIRAVCAGAAGPVIDGRAKLTNVPWTVDIAATSELLGGCPAAVLNDLEATAYGLPALRADELRVLQEGEPTRTNAAVIAAGTGLGEALLVSVGEGYVPRATESGHADFAARTPRELEFVSGLIEQYGRASVEHVVAGPGLVNLFRFTHRDKRCLVIASGTDEADLPARVSQGALERACPYCVEALEMFAEAYGAEAGNLALRSLARGGVYVAGGIAPKILAALEDGRFMDAFRNKPPMEDLLRSIPVAVVLNPDTALLGAAVRAAQIARGRD